MAAAAKPEVAIPKARRSSVERPLLAWPRARAGWCLTSGGETLILGRELAPFPGALAEDTMPKLEGSKTHDHLKEAFAGESQANRRYLYFAKVADIEGYPEVAGLFKDTADGETGHAHGHLDFLKQVGDPATGQPIGDTLKNLKSAVVGETYEYQTMYPGFAKTARDEGFGEIAEWFETLAKAEKSHAGRFDKAAKELG